MNYNRGTTPSSQAGPDVEHWHDYNKMKPWNGQYVVLLFKNGGNDPQLYETQLACYCNNEFYTLSYDEHLDVLRKSYVERRPDCWSNWVQHSTSEV